MGQLAFPIAVMMLLALVAAWAGVRIGRRWSRVGVGVVCGVAVTVMLTHALFLGDNLLLARVFPVADVVVWGNVQPIATGLLAGVAWTALRTPRWQRVFFVGVLGVLAVYRAYWPVAGEPPVTRADTWSKDVCRQSTLSTCSAAAAATALRACGIEASESEMARLCLTRMAGTTNLGLYRGLKLKTARRRVAVEIFSGSPEQLASLPGPCVISIASTFRDRSSWQGSIANSRHSVVVTGGRPDGSLDVADPYTGGHQRYTIEALREAWDGRGIRLVSGG